MKLLSLAKVIEAKAPTKNKVVVNKKNNLITVEIATLRRARRKAERKYRKSKSDEDLRVFKDFVPDVSHTIKKLRKDFYANKLTNCKYGRETFPVVNKFLDKRTTKGVLPAHHDDEKLCNDIEQFFQEKIEKIRKDIEEELRNSPSNAVDLQEERYKSMTNCRNLLC